jgi:hypothetical protein
MKINIGPYQIAEKILFWKDKYNDEVVYKLGNFLASGTYSSNTNLENETWLYKFCSWIHSFKKRKVEINIDNYDVWDASYSLGLIILPILKKLKENKHGSPFVDPMDVPENLRPTKEDGEKTKEDFGYVDEKFHARWEWILDQIIWSFENHLDEEADLMYYQNGVFDWDGLKTSEEKKQTGFILFGKYYQNLWD